MPDLRKALWQMGTSFVPFAALWVLAAFSLRVSYWLALPLIVLAAGLIIRIFIIQHDCGHGSFFRSRRANDIVGSICGVLTLVPYHYWRRTHAMHHASSGRLEQRGVGDIPTLTVREYLNRSRWGRLRYRMFRHPVILFGIGPSVLFGILYRFPKGSKSSWKIERASVAWTNVAILGVCTLLALVVGIRGFAAIQLPITMLAASAGAWLFYTQHQFKDAYWATAENWNPTFAALRGSAHYDLPPMLHWFTGNIGFHHIHHLDARIASYNLQRCHREHPELAATTVLTLRSSLDTVPLSLWDEQAGQLVSFADVDRAQREPQGHSAAASPQG